MMRLHRTNHLRLTATLLFLAGGFVAAPTLAGLIDLTPSNGSNSNSSVLLSDLVSGTVTGVTVGDKVFTGFSYNPMGDMPSAVNVQVLGFTDASGNFGVTFHGSFLDQPGGGDSDALLGFTVDVNPTAFAQGYRISDAHLFLGGVGVGPDSQYLVDESFQGLNQTLTAYMITKNGGGTQTSDSTDFTPVVGKPLIVTKDIYANASNTGFLPARATAISQSFSQSHPIPEPTYAMLSLLGIVGFGLKRTRQIG